MHLLPAFMTASSAPALIGTLDRLMGDPGSAEGTGPRLHRSHGLGGRAGHRQARGRPVSRSTVPALAGPVPVGPGPAAHLSGAQGLVREPSPGGGRPGEPRLARPRLLDDGVPSGGRCRLLGVFAHPDDETFCAGGTFARYAEQGAEIMVVSATRGQAGQIRDAAAGNRRTIAAVREAELRLACERLGITTVRCLDHVDGTLADAGFPALVDEVAEVICEFRPNVVITFAPDGGYGHPNHVTISAVTTAACQRAGPARPGTARAGRSPGPCAGRPGSTTGTSRRATC